MTSGIPTETIVKFLWFRGIFDFLYFYTTLWSYRTGDPAKQHEQKKNFCRNVTKNEKSMPGVRRTLCDVKALDMCLVQSIPGDGRVRMPDWWKILQKTHKNSDFRRSLLRCLRYTGDCDETQLQDGQDGIFSRFLRNPPHDRMF